MAKDPETMTCEDGFEVDTVLRPAGFTWLERHYGMTLSQVHDLWRRRGGIGLEGGRSMLTALALQRNSAMTDDQALKAVLDHEMELASALMKLGSIGFISQDSGSVPAGRDRMTFMGLPLRRGPDREWQVDEEQTDR